MGLYNYSTCCISTKYSKFAQQNKINKKLAGIMVEGCLYNANRPGTTLEQSQLELASTINITELLNESTAVLDEEAEDRRFSIWVSCAEIYNEFVYDLLDYSALESQSKVKDKKKKLRRTVLKLAYDRNKNCYVKGVCVLHMIIYCTVQNFHGMKFPCLCFNIDGSGIHFTSVRRYVIS